MLGRIFSYMRPYRKYTVMAVICVVLETMFELIIPLIMADIIDVGVKYGDKAYIFQQGGLMLLKVQGFSFANTDRFRTSSLITRLTSDVTTIQNSVSTGLRPACRAPVMMVTAIVVSFFINAQLALVFLVAAPLLGVLLFLIIRKVRPMYTKMQGAIDQVNRIIQENLTAIRVVKAYVRKDYEIAKFE